MYLGLENILSAESDSQGQSGRPLKNVWVCGPPPMNNMFQRLRKGISRDFGNCTVEIF